MIFNNRAQAGRLLTKKILDSRLLEGDKKAQYIILALPRGGVPVAYEMAKALELALDVIMVRKISAPDQPELALGAVAEDGEYVFNEGIIQSYGFRPSDIEALARDKEREIKGRVKRFRNGEPPPDLKGKTVILVDDGLATGSSAFSAIQLLRKKGAAKVILALPVCPASAVSQIQSKVDELVILDTPRTFQAVGQFYQDFRQVTDEEVVDYLRELPRRKNF